MAKKKTSKKEEQEADGSSVLQQAYLNYIEKYNKRPASGRELCEEAELSLELFNEHYKNLAALEKAMWLRWFNETITVLQSSEEYTEYLAQEKLFAFLYTWLETIEPHLNYIKLAPRFFNIFRPDELVLYDFKQAYLAYTAQLAEQAKENGELKSRPVIESFYNDAFWTQLIFTLNYWMKDESEDKVKTDEAIERSVSLAFEWMGRNPIDSILEFGKFLFEKKNGRTEEDTNG